MDKTFTENGLDLNVNKLSVSCITSNNDNFSLDSEGNLVVKSIQASNLNGDLKNILDTVYPVGSLYLSVSTTNPTELFGGTWEKFSQGRTLVGLDENDTDFNQLNKVGGLKDVTLTTAQLPSHTHSGKTSDSGEHTHQNRGYYDLGSAPSSTTGRRSPSRYTLSSDPLDQGAIQNAGIHNHTFTTSQVGSNQSHSNIQPYIVVNIWQRIK